MSSIVLLLSFAIAAPGDQFRTMHSQVDVISQPVDLILGPGESLDVEFELEVLCEEGIGEDLFDASTFLCGGEFCSTSITFDATASLPEISISVPDEFGSFFNPNFPDGQHGTPLRTTFTAVIESAIDYDGDPFTIDGEFRMFDGGEDPAELVPNVQYLDSRRFTLSVGVNGGSIDNDGDTAPTSDPGAILTEESCDLSASSRTLRQISQSAGFRMTRAATMTCPRKFGPTEA